MKYFALDLFSGCGGLSLGMAQAGFKVAAAVEIDKNATETFKLNHPNTKVINKDIYSVDSSEIKEVLKGETLHLLAGCPPCQGFSAVRRLNRKMAICDERNNLILEFLRFIIDLKPLTVMMENVPGISDYYLFKKVMNKLEKLGYYIKSYIINVKDYGVPQRRRRLVLLGSVFDELRIAEPTYEKVTVRKIFEDIKNNQSINDPLQNMTVRHSDRIKKIISLIPKNGGSRRDIPKEFELECHKKDNIGFNDIYGRLRWDDYSSTITGGCLNPSKGRFLHPEENRVITPREAALLQTFSSDYLFPSNISKTSLAALIGNALPPKFSYMQSKTIIEHLDKFLG